MLSVSASAGRAQSIAWQSRAEDFRAPNPAGISVLGQTPLSETSRSPALTPAILPRAHSSQPSTFPSSTPAPPYHDYFHALGYSFTFGLFAGEQLAPLAVGSVVALALSPFDRKLSDAASGKARSLGRIGEVVGHPLTLGGVSGGLILASLATDNARFRTYAFTLTQGLIVAGSVATVTKLAIRRPRPTGENKWSFPSGHAAVAFALATVSSHYYGKGAGIPLYTLASFVALSRVERGKHFPTDVVMGATVGYISGRAAILGTRHVTVRPAGGAGVRVSVTF